MLPISQSKVWAKWDVFSAGTLIGTKKLFWKLTWRPVESEKVLSKPFKLNNCLASASIINHVSSAYWTIGKNSLKSLDKGWFKTPASQALLITVYKRSAAKTNNKGDSGSPCLTPLLHEKDFPGTPFKRTEEVPDLSMTLTHSIHLLGKALNFIMSKIAWCSSLSKAFSKSNFKMTISFFEWWQMCKN